MTFADRALPLAERGHNVFPLIPGLKSPLASPGQYDHFDTATTDPEQIRQWDKQKPNANVGMVPDEIWCYVETDDETAFRASCADLPPDIFNTTRVSARANRCYWIYRQTARTRKSAIRDKAAGRKDAGGKRMGNLFEFKAFRTYVTGPGSIHPKTGKPYEADWQTAPAMPDALLNRMCELIGEPNPTAPVEMSELAKAETDKLDRFLETYEVATLGDWFRKGKQWYRPIECPWSAEHENGSGPDSTCVVYTEGEGYGFDCKHRCSDKEWRDFRAELQARHPDKKFIFKEPGTTGQVTIGGVLPVSDAELAEAMAPVDWRTHYHTLEEMENAPPVDFLIDGFLAQDAVTAIAAPVAQRKTLIALNVAWSLLTGEPLFDYFKVSHRPTRVLYLCPEMGLRSFTDRVRKIGLLPYVCTTLFCRTLSAEGTLELEALTPEELAGSLVIIDTAVRYLKGDESSSEHMRVFAESIFRLIRAGAISVLLLHHSTKGTKEAPELTLENAMRGSGELGAFLSSCWATRLQEPARHHESESFLVNVKQRDFESKAFNLRSGKDEQGRYNCRLHIVGAPGDDKVLIAKAGRPGDADRREDEAIQFMRDNPDTSVRDVVRQLKELGIRRGKTWVSDKRYEILHTGVKASSHR